MSKDRLTVSGMNAGAVKIKRIVREFNERAVFSDGTGYYRSPAEPMPGDTVSIKIRTARGDADEIYLISAEKRRAMKLTATNTLFDYYTGQLEVSDSTQEYYFLIWCGEEYYYYTLQGVSREYRDGRNFIIMPGFKTPEWSKGAVMYQIFTDRFCNGDIKNSVLSHEYSYIEKHSVQVTDWYKMPDKDGIREFYGGDLSGCRKCLDYLQNLGVEVLYMNPLFVSPSNHKYDIQDYDYIDPHFTTIPYDGGQLLADGDNDNTHAERYIKRVTDKRNLEASNEYFASFVEEVHKRGMKIILDGVFNHCGSFNKWLDRQMIYKEADGFEKGAYIEKDSPYNSFFNFREDNWPKNGSYDGWWGHETLPKLNYEKSSELFKYILDIAVKWVTPPFNIDGWRLDVAADLGYSREFNHRFWKAFRSAVKTANPEVLIIAENYGDSWEWLQGDEWDTIMNYEAFMEPITWFLTGMEKHSDEYKGELHSNSEIFFSAMNYHMSRMNTQSLYSAMNELSNHDHSRFMTRTNGMIGRTQTRGPEAAGMGINPAVMREAVLIQMTWPGAPAIYYGDEAGLCGWTDPDNRRTYPWGREDKTLIYYHKELIKLHKSYEALLHGSIKLLSGYDGMISYGRFTDRERFVIAVNNNSHHGDIDIPVWETGITDHETMVRLAYTSKDGFGFDAALYKSEQGVLRLHMGPYSAVILKNMPSYLS